MTDIPLPSGISLGLVRTVLDEYLRSREGQALRSIRPFRVLQKTTSAVVFLLVQTRAANYRFVVKQVRNHPLNPSLIGGRHPALVEFDILNRLYPRFRCFQHCSVPRPVAVLPECNAFIMEYVDGRLMTEELCFVRHFGSRRGFGELQDHVYRCGQWLRLFREFNGWRSAGADAIGSIIKRCEDRLRIIEESGKRRCPRDFRTRVMAFLQDRAAELADGDIMLTVSHGDFAPWNVFVTRNGIVVIDTFGLEEMLPMDILKMLVLFDILMQHPFSKSARITALSDRFRSGLGPLPEVPRALAVICESFHRISSMAGDATARDEHVVRRMERAASYMANLRWLLKGPTESALWHG